MVHRSRLICASALAAVTAACASGAPPIVEPQPRYAEPFPGAAILSIARANDYVCREAFVRAFVDGEFAGQFGPGGVMALYLPPGAHVIAVAPNARCLLETASLPLVLNAATPRALITDFDLVGHIRLQAQTN